MHPSVCGFEGNQKAHRSHFEGPKKTPRYSCKLELLAPNPSTFHATKQLDGMSNKSRAGRRPESTLPSKNTCPDEATARTSLFFELAKSPATGEARLPLPRNPTFHPGLQLLASTPAPNRQQPARTRKYNLITLWDHGCRWTKQESPKDPKDPVDSLRASEENRSSPRLRLRHSFLGFSKQDAKPAFIEPNPSPTGCHTWGFYSHRAGLHLSLGPMALPRSPQVRDSGKPSL